METKKSISLEEKSQYSELYFGLGKEIQNELDSQPWYQRIVCGLLFSYHRYRFSRLVDGKLINPAVGDLVGASDPIFYASDSTLEIYVNELYNVKPFSKINSRPSTK